MATQYSNSPADNGQLSQDIDNRIGDQLISTQQALVLGARACNAILFGQPAPATFCRADLSQALAILSQMACTIAATAEVSL